MCAFVCVCCVYVHTDVSPLKGLKRPRNRLTQEVEHPGVVMKCHFPLKKPGFLEKWLIPGSGRERYMMCLEHLLTLPESKEAIKEHQGRVKRTQKPI